MKKKIIALVMIIPIVFLIALFSVGKVAGVYTDIPVTGIRITTQSEDGFIHVNIAEYEPMEFFAQVEPVNARNQKYEFTISGVGGEDAPKGFEIKNGKLVITDVGKAKITAISAEKGFKDSVIVEAYSTKVLRIYPIVNGAEVFDGEEVEIKGGSQLFSARLYPENLGASPNFEVVGDNDVLKINPVTGVAQAMFSGKTQIKITCPDGKAGLEKIVNVNVEVEKSKENIAVNGKSGGAVVSLINNADTASLFVESDSTPKAEEIELPDGIVVDKIVPLPLSDNRYVVKLRINKEISDTRVDGKVGDASFSLEFSEYSMDILTSYYSGGDADKPIKQKNKTTVTYVAYSANEGDEEISFEIKNGADVISLEHRGRMANITAIKRGEATIIITAKKGGAVIKEERHILVVPNVYSVEFEESKNEYGIENILTIGGNNANGAPEMTKLSMRILTENGVEPLNDDFTKISFDNNEYLASSADVGESKITANLRVKKTGITTLRAKLEAYNEYFKTNVDAKIKLRAVKEACNVWDYASLKKATEDGNAVVIKNNIMLGTNKDGTKMSLEDLNANVKETETTYDKTYLVNNGKNTKIKYLIEFKKDVYGNGFEINADAFTRCVDGTGVPQIFKGPLDFVAISTASVKAQDNISFLVRTEGVVINNVVLKGCKDESLLEDGKFNLSNLNNVGTTLEIAKSVRILNSRVSNGRTVVRVFAGESTMGSPVVENTTDFNVQKEKINVHIESCVLSNAREFILKIGSNRALKQIDRAQRELLDANGKAYEPYIDSNKTDKYFNDNYLINDVTLKNSVLETSGLFSIGMETHFSGEVLYGEGNAKISIPEWKGSASTSYASALRIVGDVKLLDWKNLSNVDSSTLIEVTSDANAWLTFDVAAMLNEFSKKNEFSDIIYREGGVNNVHGGIAFYGGGYNYSYLDLSQADEAMKCFGEYNVKISVLKESKDPNIKQQGELLPLAAGNGAFKFYIYNNSSSRNLSWQENIKNEGIKMDPVVWEEVS